VDERISSFRVEIPGDDLDDLRERLRRARYPEDLDDPDWSYGIPHDVLRPLVAYWLEKFDWRAAESRLNAFPNFRTEVEGQKIHFIHARSPHADAFPLIITHGWPGSVVEFLEMLGPLTEPEKHGGEASDAFHVVCPSLPGYGFSQPNNRKGWNPQTTAPLWAELMRRLGYGRYGAQGGDWGSFVTQELARHDPEHCVGLHLNFLFQPPTHEDDLANLASLSQPEQDRWHDFARYSERESGYAAIQGTKPQTLGYLLADSPVGQLAWIAEKFRAWTDCDGVIENAIDLDALLANVSLYWFTNTGASSGRFYYETRRGGVTFGSRLETPLGHACFPKELFGSPRSWIERSYNVVQWTDMPCGGHFAAMEQPELLVNDIRSFFRHIRS
jgi:pimeloyl-ACP methyl ester carboxylesterase